MSTARDTGNRGEAAAAKFLEQRGYEILAAQWKCRYGEADLVAQSPSGTVCFVEVKLRGVGAIGLPREFVDARKQERLRKTAAVYLQENDLYDVSVRFDVAEVYAERDHFLRIEYLEDAFI